MHRVSIKRIYEDKNSSDGYRVLIDKLWPRGISKSKAALDDWLKDLSPSDELREWFNHDPKRWAEFKKKYTQELKSKKEILSDLLIHLNSQNITLLFGAKDEQHNNAVVLKDYLNKLIKKKIKTLPINTR